MLQDQCKNSLKEANDISPRRHQIPEQVPSLQLKLASERISTTNTEFVFKAV